MRLVFEDVIENFEKTYKIILNDSIKDIFQTGIMLKPPKIFFDTKACQFYIYWQNIDKLQYITTVKLDFSKLSINDLLAEVYTPDNEKQKLYSELTEKLFKSYANSIDYHRDIATIKTAYMKQLETEQNTVQNTKVDVKKRPCKRVEPTIKNNDNIDDYKKLFDDIRKTFDKLEKLFDTIFKK